MDIDSQQAVNDYFSQRDKQLNIPKSERNRLVVGKDEKLYYRKLSFIERVEAFFGKGPASFKKIINFCNDHNITHEKLSKTVDAYAEIHYAFKTPTLQTSTASPQQTPTTTSQGPPQTTPSSPPTQPPVSQAPPQQPLQTTAPVKQPPKIVTTPPITSFSDLPSVVERYNAPSGPLRHNDAEIHGMLTTLSTSSGNLEAKNEIRSYLQETPPNHAYLEKIAEFLMDPQRKVTESTNLLYNLEQPERWLIVERLMQRAQPIHSLLIQTCIPINDPQAKEKLITYLKSEYKKIDEISDEATRATLKTAYRDMLAFTLYFNLRSVRKVVIEDDGTLKKIVGLQECDYKNNSWLLDRLRELPQDSLTGISLEFSGGVTITAAEFMYKSSPPEVENLANCTTNNTTSYTLTYNAGSVPIHCLTEGQHSKKGFALRMQDNALGELIIENGKITKIIVDDTSCLGINPERSLVTRALEALLREGKITGSIEIQFKGVSSTVGKFRAST